MRTWEAKRVLEALKLNGKTLAVNTLKPRIDLCQHAAAVKDGEFASMTGPELTAHLVALKEYWHLFPMDIMGKLCLHKSSVLLDAITRAKADPKSASEGIRNGVLEWCQAVQLLPSSESDNSQLGEVGGSGEENQIEKDDDQGNKGVDFNPLDPSFSSIVRMIQKANQRTTSTEAGLSGGAANLSWVFDGDEDVKDDGEDADSEARQKVLLETSTLQEWGLVGWELCSTFWFSRKELHFFDIIYFHLYNF